MVDDKKPTIACDFDGVINSYSSGFTDQELPDPPVAGAIEWLEEIIKTCDVVIHTARLQPDQPEQEEFIRAWLLANGLSNDTLSKLKFERKVVATVYLDDRAIQFTGRNFPTYEEVKRFEPWTEQIESRVEQTDDVFHWF